MCFKQDAIEKLEEMGKLIGNTPIISLHDPKYLIYAKLEYKNFSGSIKDRAVNNILSNAVKRSHITVSTKVIESSSGNFAVSLAGHCNRLGLKSQIVVDSNTNPLTIKKLKLFGAEVVYVDEEDPTGGYLLNRIKKVKELCEAGSDMYWTNQYENDDNYMSYFKLAEEIKASFSKLDVLFISVSTCGTISGLSKFLKSKFPNLRVIAVDIEGSMIFNSLPKKRFLSGLGSSRKPHFDMEYVDESVILEHYEIIQGCRTLVEKHGVFVGASSGAAYSAALKYLETSNIDQNSTILLLFPDSGEAYMDTVYNENWVKMTLNTYK